MANKRKVEYSNGTSKFDGFFHLWLINKDQNGNDFVKALIEDEEGFVFEVDKDLVRFVSEDSDLKLGLRVVNYTIHFHFPGYNREGMR